MLFGVLLAAAAGPVYLDCVFPRDGKPLSLEATLDEVNQRATIALETGYMVVKPALFSPDRVVVRDKDDTWSFSRTDLSMRRTFSFMPPNDPGEAGTCKIKPAPAKRAF